MPENQNQDKSDNNVIKGNKNVQISVYIRTVSKKSFKINVTPVIKINELKEIIYKMFSIIQNNQVLYLKGIEINNKNKIKLSENNIIHVINLQNVKLSKINIQFKIFTNINLHPINIYIDHINLSSGTIVKDFIQQIIINKIQEQLSLKDIVLIESSRVLNMEQKFIEQNIQNGTVITIARVINDQNRIKKIYKNFLVGSQINTSQNFISIKSLKLRQVSSQHNFIQSQQSKDKKEFRKSVQKNNPETYQKINFKLLEAISNQKKLLRTKSIVIGSRECGCKKDKKHHNLIQNGHHEQKKFIDLMHLKTLQKQIRLKNFQTELRKKNKNNSNQLNSVSTGKFNKVKSLKLIHQ